MNPVTSTWEDPRKYLNSNDYTFKYLVGDGIESFANQLPTGLQVVQLYCHEWVAKKSNSEKIERVATAIISIWNQARIPTKNYNTIRQKVERLTARLKKIIRTRTKSTLLQVQREDKFLSDCRELFDVMDKNSEASLSAESQKFLNDQRNFRLLEIPTPDKSSESQHRGLTENMMPSDENMDRTDPGNENYEDDGDNSSGSDDETPPMKKLEEYIIENTSVTWLTSRQMKLVTKELISEFGEEMVEFLE